MQKILSITLLLLFPMLLYAQSGRKPKHNVTKFLGIPVDGSKWTMIQKLKEKGFVRVPNKEDMLEGEFNGEKSYIHIITNNNKVWRICVADKTNSSEVQIKIRYNELIQQFRNNNKYKENKVIEWEFKVPELPGIGDLYFDRDVDNEKYQASFWQAPWDNEMPMRKVWFQIFKYTYGQYTIAIFYDNLFNEPIDGEDL